MLVGILLIFLVAGFTLRTPAPASTEPKLPSDVTKVPLFFQYRLGTNANESLSVQVNGHRGYKVSYSGRRWLSLNDEVMTPEEDRAFRTALLKAIYGQTRRPGPRTLHLQGKLGDLEINQEYQSQSTEESQTLTKIPPLSRVLERVRQADPQTTL